MKSSFLGTPECVSRASVTTNSSTTGMRWCSRSSTTISPLYEKLSIMRTVSLPPLLTSWPATTPAPCRKSSVCK